MQKERVKIPMFALHENNLQSIKKLSERDTVGIHNYHHMSQSPQTKKHLRG